jgi:hypothetical protein
MAIEVRPAHAFEDVATMVGDRRLDANVRWCLSYRIPSRDRRRRRARPPAVEAYPVDNGGCKVDQTMARVGTRRIVARASFAEVAHTTWVLTWFPRILMRLDLR